MNKACVGCPASLVCLTEKVLRFRCKYCQKTGIFSNIHSPRDLEENIFDIACPECLVYAQPELPLEDKPGSTAVKIHRRKLYLCKKCGEEAWYNYIQKHGKNVVEVWMEFHQLRIEVAIAGKKATPRQPNVFPKELLEILYA